MKIEVRTAYLDRDNRSYLEIIVDDRLELYFCDGEPEDNSLGRNFSGCYCIHELMERAWKAGRNGDEKLEIIQEKVDWEEI